MEGVLVCSAYTSFVSCVASLHFVSFNSLLVGQLFFGVNVHIYGRKRICCGFYVAPGDTVTWEKATPNNASLYKLSQTLHIFANVMSLVLLAKL